MKTTELEVRGMSCGNCVRHVETALKGFPEVQSAVVSLADSAATLEHGEGLDLNAVIQALDEEGYSASVKSS